jgi:hypothetical protein
LFAALNGRRGERGRASEVPAVDIRLSFFKTTFHKAYKNRIKRREIEREREGEYRAEGRV